MSKISIFSRIFFVSQCRKFSNGNPLVFHSFRLSKKCGKEGRGSIAILRRSFCLTVTKFFIGEHFGVSENSFIEKFHA